MSPYVKGMWAYNDQGQGGQISGPTLMSGVLPAAQGAQRWADNNMAQRMQGIVNPQTGELTRQPQTPAEAAYAQSQLEKWSSNQMNANQNAAYGMLAGSFGGSPGGSGDMGSENFGFGGGDDSYNESIGLPKDFGSNTGVGSPNGSSNPFQGPQKVSNKLRQPNLWSNPAMGPRPVSEHSGEAMMGGGSGGVGQYASQMINGGRGGQAGALGFGGAGGMKGGLTGGGYGSSSGTQAGGFAANKGLHAQFTNRLGDTLQNPGLKQDTIQSMIGKGTDEISEGEKAASLDLNERANAMGGGSSGGLQAGMRELSSDYAGKKADLGRTVRNDAERDRLDRIDTATNTAGNYLGKVQDRAAADARAQQAMARDDRNMMIGMLQNQKYSVPNVAGAMGTDPRFGISLGFGGGKGGANVGNMSGGTGSMNFGSSLDGGRAGGGTSGGLASRWGAPALSGQGGVLGFGSSARRAPGAA